MMKKMRYGIAVGAVPAFDPDRQGWLISGSDRLDQASKALPGPVWADFRCQKRGWGNVIEAHRMVESVSGLLPGDLITIKLDAEGI